MNITFYTFSKKENSTKIPNVAGYSVSGEIKHGCSITAPVIDIRNNGNTPLNYNYCYIPAFNRYYFISNWVIDAGIWTATCTIDVLASWKSNILNSSEYVLRSASEFDTDIQDTMYPATTDIYQETNTIGFFPAVSYTTGSFIVGILGSGGINGVTYYVMSVGAFNQLLDKLTNNTDYLGITDISNELTKGLFNPFQYFTKAFFLPFEPSNISSGVAEDIKVGWWNSGISGKRLNPSGVVELTKTIEYPKHLQFPTRGNYLKCAPYTKYTLTLQPFGSFVLDPNAMKDGTAIWIRTRTDLLTGDTLLKIALDGSSTTLAIGSANIASELPLGQTSSNPLGMLTSIGSLAAETFTGDFIGAAASIGNALTSVIPQVNARGSQGGFSTYKEKVTLHSMFYQVTDEDNVHLGRPLCKKRILKSLSGYTKVADADFSAPCTKEENQKIKTYMEGGFYIE